VSAKVIKFPSERPDQPNASFRKSLEKPKLEFNTFPSLKTARFRQLPRAASLSSRRFNRRGTPGPTNDSTPPLHTSARREKMVRRSNVSGDGTSGPPSEEVRNCGPVAIEPAWRRETKPAACIPAPARHGFAPRRAHPRRKPSPRLSVAVSAIGHDREPWS
jgi:hypothetical protein